MVEVIAPLSMHPVTTGRAWRYHAKVVGIGLSDKVYVPAFLLCEVIDHGAQQHQKRLGVAIDNSMDGASPGGVGRKFVEPVDCVLDEKSNNMIALWAVEIDRLAPRCVIAIRKI